MLGIGVSEESREVGAKMRCIYAWGKKLVRQGSSLVPH